MSFCFRHFFVILEVFYIVSVFTGFSLLFHFVQLFFDCFSICCTFQHFFEVLTFSTFFNFFNFSTFRFFCSGRYKIPSGVMALFRTVCVVRPDMRTIAELILFVNLTGTNERINQTRRSDASMTSNTTRKTSLRSLAEKVSTVFEQAEIRLGKEKHYDWSLRMLCKTLKFV